MTYKTNQEITKKELQDEITVMISILQEWRTALANRPQEKEEIRQSLIQNAKNFEKRLRK